MRHRRNLQTVGIMLVGLLLVGCKSPMEVNTEAALRQQVIQSHRAYLEAVSAAPVIELTRQASEIEQELAQKDQLAVLDGLAGPSAYENVLPMVGDNLLGQRSVEEIKHQIQLNEQAIEQINLRREVSAGSLTGQELKVLEQQVETLGRDNDALQQRLSHANAAAVAMSLQQAIHLAAKNNLDVAVARLRPAISQARLTQAEAVFDAVYFGEYDYNKLDTPSPPAALAGFGATRSNESRFRTGIRKALTSGGSVEVATEFTRRFDTPTIRSVEAFDSANLTVSLTQPLLRNFGGDVALAEVYINRNARATDVEALRQTLLDAVAATEQAYWQLVFARQQLLIQQRLLDSTVKDRDVIQKRYAANFDASRVQLSEANSFVAQRRADLIRARQNIRIASDRLKQLINDPNLSVADETLIVPMDQPADSKISFNLLDAVTTALQRRPEMQQALLAINDATIRQRVADNQRLPELNLNAVIRYSGTGNTTHASYEQINDGQFIDYLIGFQFEQPIGNRGPQAQYRRFQLERQTAVTAYQRQAQIVVLEVKESLRTLIGSYEVINAQRDARRAAADNVRAINAQINIGVELTPEFVDRKLRRDEALAQAELAEMQALTSYNTAVSNFHRATGALLERNGIDFSEQAVNKH